MSSLKLTAVPMVGFIFLILLQLAHAHSHDISPTPAGPSNDGAAIDQGIAYVLLLVALVVTYIIH